MSGFRTCLILLLISGADFPAAVSGSNLECTNDFEELTNCTFKAQNCSQYNLTILDITENGYKQCIFQECDHRLCCCSVQMIYYIDANATVWKGNKYVESKYINSITSIKPKAPTLISVNESNGNFLLMWETNMKGIFSTKVAANVTYHKKGDTKKVSTFLEPTHSEGFNLYEIPGRHLEPSTTYVVSVRTYTDWSKKYSDSSNEWEFTTAASAGPRHLAIIVSLSIAAVIITGAVFGCYVKIKAKWLDYVARCPKPELDYMNPGMPKFQILKPLPTNFSSICVEHAVPSNSKPWSEGSVTDSGNPQQSSEISENPSLSCKPVDIKARVQNALNESFPQITPLTPETTSHFPGSSTNGDLFSTPCGVSAAESNVVFDNMTYFIRFPSCPKLIVTDGSEVHEQDKVICESQHHLIEGNTVTCAEQQNCAM